MFESCLSSACFLGLFISSSYASEMWISIFQKSNYIMSHVFALSFIILREATSSKQGALFFPTDNFRRVTTPNAKENFKLPLLSHASPTLQDYKKTHRRKTLRQPCMVAGVNWIAEKRLASPHSLSEVFSWSPNMGGNAIPQWTTGMRAGASVVGRSMEMRRARKKRRRLAVNRRLATAATSSPGCRTRLPVAARM